MKLGILCGVVLGLVAIAGIVAGVVAFAIVPFAREVTSQTLNPGPSGQNPIVSAVPATSSIPSQTPAPAVAFSLQVVDFSLNGFSADITAQVSNIGNADAHNIQARIQAISAGSLIQLNNLDSVMVPVGNLPARQATTVKTTLGLNFIDGLKVSSSGATIYLWLISDEKTQNFSYDYHP
jgi:hypothetical protein